MYQHKVSTKTRVTDFSFAIKRQCSQCLLSLTGTIYPVHGAADIETIGDALSFCMLVVVVVCTSRSENSTKRSRVFTQFAVVSTFYTSQGDIYSQWEIVKK